jgi:glycosyltransferase involved in cell wall biosynthesis
MKTPLVSILIPAFNSERFIGQCVESVLGQGYGRVEVIVVDDGSSDGTREMLECYKEVKVISQTNQGACVARNKALVAAEGDYVKFLDADDFLLAGAISSQVDAMKRLDGNSLVYGDYSILREGAVRAVNNVVIQPGCEQLAQLIMANILTSTPMHRKDLLDKVGGFDARFKSGQEWNLHVRLAAKGARFVYQPAKVYTHRIHFSADRISIKRKNSPSRLEGELEKILMTLESVGGTVSETSLAAFSACVWEIGRAALREGKQDLARSCFDLAKTVSRKNMKLFWPTFYKLNHDLFGVRAAEKISQLTMHFKKSLFY